MEAQDDPASFSPAQGQRQWFDIKGGGDMVNLKLVMGLVLGIGIAVILLIMTGVCVVFWRLRKGPVENFVVVCESAADEERDDQKLRASQKQLPAPEQQKEVSGSRGEKPKLSKEILLQELRCMSKGRGKKSKKSSKEKLSRDMLQEKESDVCEDAHLQDLEAGNAPRQNFYEAHSSTYQALLDRKEALKPMGNGDIQVFSLKYLQIAANGFADRNVLLERSFCRVFKAYLITGEPVVVEVLYCGGRLEAEKFRRHVETLSRLQSPYLVRLLGYCAEADQRLLIMEYMPKGSLKDQLHGASIIQRHALTWQRRLHIAYCVAQGLVYLHETVEPSVCHMDLESGNIMLDSYYNAKLVDFCVTALLEVETGRNMSNNVLGSFTYQAPEFRANGVRTTKSDVFSFGVVMLELLTGRKPIDTERPKGQQSLVSWVLPQIEHPQQLQNMVDPPLKFNGVVEPDSFLEFAQIAGKCLEYDPQERPKMSEVMKLITKLIAKHIPRQTSSTGSVSSSDSAAVLDDEQHRATTSASGSGSESEHRVNCESESSDPSNNTQGSNKTAPYPQRSTTDSLRVDPAPLKISGNLAGRRKAQKGLEGSKHWTCNEERSPGGPSLYRPRH